MARDFSPRGRLERREQQDLSLFSGVTARESKIRHGVVPGGIKGTNVTPKLSEYGKQLRAKQVAKRIYGLLERQFSNYFKEAARLKGSTGSNLLCLLERRLDNVVYRLGFARTRKEARQMVVHRAILVNGKTVNIPSYSVGASDKITIREGSANQGRIQEALKLSESNRTMPEWLERVIHEGLIKRLPERDDMSTEVNDQLIVELYSK
jgi:small subunit ribosomal protein S4